MTRPIRLIALVLAAVAAAAGCDAAALDPEPTVRPTPRYTVPPATEEPVFTAPPGEVTLALREKMPIILLDDGSDLGTVAVLAGKRYRKVGEYWTADKGKAWIGAKVQYVAVAPFDYNLFDWVAHDSEGNQYQASGMPLDPQLQAGTLANGRKATGWVAFEVPSGLKALWVDYAPGGSVIFTVKVYP